MIETLVLILIADSGLRISGATLYLNEITLSCETLVAQNIRKDFQISLGGKNISVSIESLKIESENIHGYFLGRYVEAQRGEIEFKNFQLYGACLSLCGLTCPNGGIFTKLIKIQEQKVKIENPEVRFLNLQIPLFFLPEKLDNIGRAPGFTNPIFSISKKNGKILGIDYFSPIKDFEFSFSTVYFERKKIFLAGIGSSLRDFLFLEARYANPDIFAIKNKLLFKDENYHISSYGDIFTKDFIQNIPARIESGGKPFGLFYEESFGRLGDTSIYNYIYIFSEFLTRNESFSELLISYNAKNLSISAGGTGYIFYSERNFSPATKFLYSKEGIRISGKVIANPKPKKETLLFIPYEAYLYLFSEDFLYPLVFSLSYSDFSGADIILTHSYTGLNLLGLDFPPKNFGIVPELGNSLIFGGINTFLSIGGIYSRGLSVFSDSGIILATKSVDIQIRNSTYKDKVLSQFSLSSSVFFSKFHTIRNEIAILFSNQAPYFGGESKKFEMFPIYRATFVFSDLKLQPNLSLYLLKQIKPIQFSLLLNYRIKRLCSDFYADLVYNFTKIGETRLSFGIKINL